MGPGARLGQYEIQRTIGRGGMGIVYEARHPGLGKRVALKVLLPELAEDSEIVTRFLREGRAAARIRHPHIVDVTDLGTAEGTAYLVMELLEGETLAAHIARSAPLDPAGAVDLLLPVCSALQAAHDQGVLHRDLKPENVFLARAQGIAFVHPKVLDFGIAKIQGEAGTLSSTGRHVIGTPHYMSIEQLRSASSVDPRSDQYSLGVIAYEALTGRKPYAGESAAAVVTAALLDTPASPRAIAPAIPAGLEAAVLRAMGRLPEERFATMRALGAALVPFASAKARMQWGRAFGLDTLAPPPPVAAEAPRSSREAGPCRILVIEDDPNIRANLVELLENEGFAPTAVATGEEGLAIARKEAPDLVLCDVTLPGADGYAVLSSLRADPRTRSTPFVFLSGRADKRDVRAGMNLGADDYLTKPFSRAELLEALRIRLERFGVRQSGEAHAPTLVGRDRE